MNPAGIGAAAAGSPTLESLQGLWMRSSIRWPDGRGDTTTRVWWLQARELFADLRQPAGAPDFTRVRRLADLDDEQMSWMASQEGFAGELRFDGDCFEWDRAIDFQPATAHADRGWLRFEGEVLTEHGASIPYLERWHRAREPASCSAVRLADDAQGRSGFLVRCGTTFMYARGRAVAAPALGSLSACIRAADSREAACRLLDFEVSLGRICAAGWRIERSSLPFRVGTRLQPRFHGTAAISVIDDDFDAGRCERRWRVTALHGRAEDLFGNMRDDTGLAAAGKF